MSAFDALIRCLEPVAGATAVAPTAVAAESKRVPCWTTIGDDDWLARLSDGERALVWAGLQLWNGGGGDIDMDLHRAVCHLDLDNKRVLIEALADACGFAVTLTVRTSAAERVAEHRGDRQYLKES